MELNWVAILVTVLGAGGIGATAREIVNAVTLASRGVSGREDRRRGDIIASRDWALLRAKEADQARAEIEEELERERRRRQFYQEQLAVLRRVLIDRGGDPGDWPIEDTERP